MRQKNMFITGGRVPLHEYCGKGRADRVMDELDRSKEDLNARDYNGSTPIHYAVYNDYPAIVKLLCEAGAELAFSNSLGDRPLDLAIRHGHLECLGILLAHGARLEDAREKGRITDEMRDISQTLVERYFQTLRTDDCTAKMMAQYSRGGARLLSLCDPKTHTLGLAKQWVFLLGNKLITWKQLQPVLARCAAHERSHAECSFDPRCDRYLFERWQKQCEEHISAEEGSL